MTFGVGEINSRDGKITLRPDVHGTDGFFIAGFRRTKWTDNTEKVDLLSMTPDEVAEFLSSLGGARNTARSRSSDGCTAERTSTG